MLHTLRVTLLLIPVLLLPAARLSANPDQAGKDKDAPPQAAPAEGQNVEALRKAAQNPIASLISVPIQENWNFGIGIDSDTDTDCFGGLWIRGQIDREADKGVSMSAERAQALSAQEQAIESGKKVIHGTVTERVLRLYEAIRAYGSPRVSLDRAVAFTESRLCSRETKRLTWDQLLDAMEKNWEGKEAVRQMRLNAPKYGNGIGIEVGREDSDFDTDSDPDPEF